MYISFVLDQISIDLQIILKVVCDISSTTLLDKRYFDSRYATFLKKKYPRRSGRIIKLEKFKTYELSHNNLWSIYKLILDQMYPLMRQNYGTHLLSEGQSECIIYYSDIDLSLRMTIHHTSLRMMFHDLFESSHK